MAHVVMLYNSPVVFLMMLTCHVPFNIHSLNKVTARRAQLSFSPPFWQSTTPCCISTDSAYTPANSWLYKLQPFSSTNTSSGRPLLKQAGGFPIMCK